MSGGGDGRNNASHRKPSYPMKLNHLRSLLDELEVKVDGMVIVRFKNESEIEIQK